jgi:hypothetical protein
MSFVIANQVNLIFTIMKRILTFLSCILMAAYVSGSTLVKINVSSPDEALAYYQDKSLAVNYYNDHFLLATVYTGSPDNCQVLDANPWLQGHVYYVIWLWKEDESYISHIHDISTVLDQSDKHLIIRMPEDKINLLYPPDKGSLSQLEETALKLPAPMFNDQKSSLKADSLIAALIEQVDQNLLQQHVQHLQDYGTRRCTKPEAILAQNWIKEQLEGYGLSVELFDFYMPQGNASDNVIATLTGTLYPDEYVVCGAHYDSYAYSGAEPGADDNASGTAGIMEVARLLSQHSFDRTIIFCAFSGEEFGLYGSEAYAAWAESQNMNILGYFNMDMCSYLNPGDPIHTDIIAPQSAQPLVEFYQNVAALYLPSFITGTGALSGGDSDHTSFNEHGYMGIFPFEDSQNYSPYIHTSDDIVGLSANSFEMARVFTQAILASVVSMANYLAPPQNLIAIPGDASIKLQWDPLSGIDHYNVYRNNGTVPIASTTSPEYTDLDVVQNNTYSYYVTAVYSGTGDESSPSNSVTITLMPPITYPFIEDFEGSMGYWSLEAPWGLSTSQSHSATHSLSESPSGSYSNNLEIASTLYPFNLLYDTTASLSFWLKYNTESGYDYLYLEITSDGTDWTELDSFDGVQSSWIQKTYSLDNYVGNPFVQIRFRFVSDGYITADGVYIDDIEITAAGNTTGTMPVVSQAGPQLYQNFPNPFKGSTEITFFNPVSGMVRLTLFDSMGQEAKVLLNSQLSPGVHTVECSAADLAPGIYYYRFETGSASFTRRMVIVK